MTQTHRPWLSIGSTGPRNGMTAAQLSALRLELQEQAEQHQDKELQVHHGNAIGADAELHGLCLELGIRVVPHPPRNERERAHCRGAADCRPSADFCEQSESIVNSTQLLIAAPNGRKERIRGSGTWMTIRRARKAGMPIVFCFPDGERVTEVEE